MNFKYVPIFTPSSIPCSRLLVNQRDILIMLAFAAALLLMVQPWKKAGKLSRLSGLVLFAGYVFYAWSLF